MILLRPNRGHKVTTYAQSAKVQRGDAVGEEGSRGGVELLEEEASGYGAQLFKIQELR